MRTGATVACIAAAASACGNHQAVVQGIRYSDDRNQLEMASIMPTCSCITLASTHREKSDGSNDIVLVSRLYGIVRGMLVLKPGEPQRVQVDWAGTKPEEVYQLAAYKPPSEEEKKENKQFGDALTPIANHVFFDQQVPTDCNPTDCPFGTLNMNYAAAARVGQGDVETHRRGVELTKAGQSLEARASSAGTISSGTEGREHCGCVALRAKRDVELRSTIHSLTLGYATLKTGETWYFGFDDGGPHEDDRYIITAVTKRSTSEQNQVTAQGGYADATLRISDFVDVLGDLDHMTCRPSAAMLNTGFPRSVPAPGPPGQPAPRPPAAAGAPSEASEQVLPPGPSAAPQPGTAGPLVGDEELRHRDELEIRKGGQIAAEVPCFFGTLRMYQNVKPSSGGGPR
jgi:hypothetical protein